MNTTLEARLNGVDLFGESLRPTPRSVTAKRFGVPPFSVLNAREGDWQQRKQAWSSIGIQSENGRAAEAFGDRSQRQNRRILPGGGGPNSLYRSGTEKIVGDGQCQTSIFDPTLCELAYSWFCPPAGQVIDPFAGGSVRGIVAACLGLRYWGCDLRGEQIAANYSQGNSICPAEVGTGALFWQEGDSMDMVPSALEADFVFSCPPYGDLERYSDDPRDLSAMEWHTFVAAYKRIILRSVERLKPNRFACFVVGDFRDPRGFYRDFVSETIRGFRDAGAELYNEAILVTSVGSASMRVARQFGAGRKLCKTHQNVLVFCKGDWRKAAQACARINEP